MPKEIYEAIGKFLINIGGPVAIAYGIFIFLGKKYIEDKFSKSLLAFEATKNKELKNLEYKINSLFDRIIKIHNIEYDILPKLYFKIYDAFKYISLYLTVIIEHPDFNIMNDNSISDFLSKNDFTTNEIENIIISKDRNNLFCLICEDKYFINAKDKYIVFRDYFFENKIFLKLEIKNKVEEIDSFLSNAIFNKKNNTFNKPTPTSMPIEEYLKLKEYFDIKIEDIIELIQERLHYNDAT